ncbi:MAG: ABC transporter substrate-binding protein [Actinomycetota bacterium]|nr:ABC transporter substrate-binding protein [Actinomycetota bacterium]
MFVALAAVALAAASCSSDPSPEFTESVTVFGPLRGDEARSFLESMAPFEERTGIDIQYVGAGSVAQEIKQRVQESDLPDVGILPQPSLVAALARDGHLVPLDGETVSTVTDNYSTAAVEMGRIDGTLYSVWYAAAVKSLVWYRPDVLAEAGYEVPETWADLMALTARIEADGFTPWCLSMESFGASGWVGTDWIEDIVLRSEDPEVYDAWAAGEVSFEEEAVKDAFAIFKEIALTPGKVAGGTRRILSTPWQQAGDPMFDDPPGCLLHRQGEVNRSFLPSGIVVGDDVDAFVLPAMDEGPPPILTGGDLAVAFSDRPAVQEFLRYLATPESGEAWAKAGGYTSPHATFDPAIYGDDFDRWTAELLLNAEVVRFDASDMMHPPVGTRSFWDGMMTLVRTGDIEAALAEIQAGYDE